MCYKPTPALALSGQKAIPHHPDSNTFIGCGTCNECLSSRASSMALRCQHELGDHDDNCFIHLTYAPDNLPTLLERQREWILFMKKLRRRCKKKILSLVSHEFGDQNGRIHHHALIFGWHPHDLYPHKKSSRGNQLYRSPLLEKVWTNGNSNIGPASAGAAYYIASYALKSKSIDTIDPDSGELITLKDIMRASTRPAIGLNYLERNHRQLAYSNILLPRYYTKRMQLLVKEPEKYAKLSNEKKILYASMLESFEIYENSRDNISRPLYHRYAKMINDDQQMSLANDYRSQKIFTKHDLLFRKLFKEETMSFLRYIDSEEELC